MSNVHDDDEETLQFADESEWMDPEGQEDDPDEKYQRAKEGSLRDYETTGD